MSKYDSFLEWARHDWFACCFIFLVVFLVLVTLLILEDEGKPPLP